MSATAQKPRLNREQQKVQRATELLDAAWQLFCQKGYETLSIDEVAEYAGYSRMPVYSLFGDKQNLFFELWRSKSSTLALYLLSECLPAKPLEENLTQLAKKITADGEQPETGHGKYLFFVVQTISLNRPDIRVKLELLARDHINQFAKMISDSAISPTQKLREPPDIIARHLLAQINGAAMVKFQTQQDFLSAASQADVFCRIALQ